MIPMDRLHSLVEKLTVRSRENKVRWQSIKGADLRDRGEFRGYRVVASNLQIDIGFVVTRTTEDYYVFRVTDDQSNIIGELRAAATSSDVEDSEELSALQSLFTEAERCATGWDRAVSTLEKLLEKDAVIGELSYDQQHALRDSDVAF